MLEFFRDAPVEMPVSADQMQDIIDIEGVFNYSWVPQLKIAFVILGLLLLCLFLYWVVKKFLTRKKDEDSVLPDIQFYNDLKKLEMQDFVTKKEERKLYFFLSEALRRFIDRHFYYQALDKTFTEIENEFLIARATEIVSAEEVRRFLKRAEEIKFAGNTVNPEEVAQDFKSLRQWVKLQVTKVSK